MWQHVAARFADHPALFGFDMLNEPFLGSDGGKLFKKLVSTAVGTVICDKRIKCFKLVGDFLNKKRRDEVKYLEQITGDVLKDVTRKAGYDYVRKFDIEKYSPFINKVSSAIREVTDKGVLVMENCYWSNTCIPCSTPAIEVNGEREKNFCFTPHGYDFMVDTPQYKYASNDRVRAIFEEHVRTQDRLDAPVLVGEWGGFGGEGEDWLPHIEFLVNFFEQHKWGFTYWHYVNDMFNSPLMKVLSRPYPMAVGGSSTHTALIGRLRSSTSASRATASAPLRPRFTYTSPQRPLRAVNTSLSRSAKAARQSLLSSPCPARSTSG